METTTGATGKGDAVWSSSSDSSPVKSRAAFQHKSLVTGQQLKQTGFNALGLTPDMLSRCKELGLTKPSDVQVNCIPAILTGDNVIASSPTGTGKTLAFAIPIVQRANIDPHPGFSLTLTPTRELAIQIADQFRSIVGNPSSICCVIGGVDFQEQSQELQALPIHIIATPGRLGDHFENNKEETVSLFRNLKFIVVDEVDRVFGGDFDEQFKTIMSNIPSLGRQNLFFSATVTDEIRFIVRMVSKSNARKLHVYDYNAGNPGNLPIDRTINQYYIFSAPDFRDGYFMELLRMVRDNELDTPVRSMMIFAPKCKDCSILGGMMKDLGFPNIQLHSHMKQKERREALSIFKSRQVSTLIATDVASRGLDIQHVDLVVNYQAPFAIDYIHRLGRAGRAGQNGIAVTFISTRDIVHLHAIEKAIGENLVQLKVSDEKVLKILNEVNAAKRSVILRTTDDPHEERLAIHKRKREILENLADDDDESDSTDSDSVVPEENAVSDGPAKFRAWKPKRPKQKQDKP